MNVKATVIDLKTLAAMPDVSVYLIPQGDTTITDFSLSGANGLVVFDKVLSGKYELNAEMLGYKTFRKTYEIYQVAGWDLDLGTIGMEEDTELIDAATITAAGNPIIIQNDTVIYNASSYRVGENAMLEDLLKKMPGVEVHDDGTATVNGEKVDRITVGGKTFFFGDPSMALKNLPAKIVKRIKVSRQESRTAQMSGISTEMDEETVMDVELKEEFREGWFGDARLGVGASVNGEGDLTNADKLLYDGSAMVSIYGAKDQAVLIGNAYNVQSGGTDSAPASVIGLPQDDYTELGGLVSAVKGGANYNTSRIKNFETTVSANYRHATKDERRRSSRTSFVSDGGNLLFNGGRNAAGTEDQLVIDAELYKQSGSLLVNFAPRFYAREGSVNSVSFSDTYLGGTSEPLHSTATSLSDSRQLLASGTLGITGTELGKPRRRIGFNLDYSAGVSDGSKLENSIKAVNYDIFGKKMDLEGMVFYYEPIGRKWGLQATLGSSCYSNANNRKAFNPDGSDNAYFTNLADHSYLQESASVLMQFSNDTSTVKFGFNGSAYNDAMDATMLGEEKVIGRGDWRFCFSPVVQYSWMRDGHQLDIQYSGLPNPASSRRMIPVPDFTDPIQVSLGNTYLKSGVSNYFSAYYSMVNYTSYTFFTAYAYGGVESNGVVDASWFDSAGTRYAVPVNARKPGSNMSVMAMLNQPFGRMKNFTFSLAAQAGFDRRYSYQATSILPGLDFDSFDYKGFMNEFWGSESGNRFYDGESGFAESLTNSCNWGMGVDLKYNKDSFTGTVSANVSNASASYSLNSAADMNVWDYSFGADLLLQPGNGWEFGTDARYCFFSGYAPGYGRPELRWNISLSKTLKSVTLGLKCRDILNQKRSLTRVVSSEYVEDSYRNVMGRTVLFSVSFNFGKLNSNKTSAVSNSIKKMSY